LIRWNSPKYGEVPAYKLITNAEEMGLIVEIGNWVFEEACMFAKEINEGREGKLGVSVNISVAQIMYNKFFKGLWDNYPKDRYFSRNYLSGNDGNDHDSVH